jgi:hypothetical protein
MGFPAASFRFVSPVFPFNLLEAREASMVMAFSFTLASGICPRKRLLYYFLWKLAHRQFLDNSKPTFSILLSLTKSERRRHFD